MGSRIHARVARATTYTQQRNEQTKIKFTEFVRTDLHTFNRSVISANNCGFVEWRCGRVQCNKLHIYLYHVGGRRILF